MKARVHAIAGSIAIVLVAAFMVTTVVTELVGDDDAVLTAKTSILYALVVLIPCVMVAGASGRAMAAGRQSPVLLHKKRRTAAVAVIGLLVLVPCALLLRNLAADGDFGTAFVALQTLELAGGTANLALLVRNARAGRAISSYRRISSST